MPVLKPYKLFSVMTRFITSIGSSGSRPPQPITSSARDSALRCGESGRRVKIVNFPGFNGKNKTWNSWYPFDGVDWRLHAESLYNDFPFDDRRRWELDGKYRFPTFDGVTDVYLNGKLV